MKKKLLLVCLLASLFSVTGCGKKDMSNNENLNNGGNEEVKENNNSKTEVLDLIYPGGDVLNEVSMSDRMTEGEDLIKVQVPSNYLIYPQDSEHILGDSEEDFPMAPGGLERVTLKEAIENGLFEYGKGISSMGISNLDTDTRIIVEANFELVKSSYSQLKSEHENLYEMITEEFGTEENPAFYLPEDYTNKNVLRFYYYINDDFYLHVWYRGSDSFIKKVGPENIIQKLYKNISVIKKH